MASNSKSRHSSLEHLKPHKQARSASRVSPKALEGAQVFSEIQEDSLNNQDSPLKVALDQQQVFKVASANPSSSS